MTNNDEAPATTDNASEKNQSVDPSTEDNSPENQPKSNETPETIGNDYLEGDSDQSEDIDYKKRYGDSTREVRKIQDENKQYQQAIQRLEALAEANPRIMREIEAAQQAGLNQQPQQSGQFNNPDIQNQLDQALEPIRKVATELQQQDRNKKAEVLADFEKQNPDLFPTNATAEQKKQVRKQIGSVAQALVNSGMEFKQAVERAYLTINPESAIRKGRDQAYLETYGDGTAEFTSQSSAETKTKKPKYRKGELEAAKKLGVFDAMLKE